MPALLTLIAFASGLIVQGQTVCPSPAEVAEELKPLLPEELAEPERHLWMSSQGGQIVLALTSEAGEVLAKRELNPQGSCGAQAKRVAVVAAAWQAELDDEPLPPPPKLEPPAPQVHAAPLELQPTSRPSDFHFEMGLRAASSPGVAFQIEMGVGRSWGRWGFLGNLEGPLIAALAGPTFLILTGYPTVVVRAQGALALGASAPNVLAAVPGVETGIRVTMGASGARGFIDVAYAHYFSDYAPAANQAIFTLGYAFGGPG